MPTERRGPVLALAAAVGLTACASQAPLEERSGAHLIGQPVENAVELLGEAYERAPAAGGGATYRWTLVEALLERGAIGPPTLGVSRRGTGTYQPGRRSAPRLVSHECDVTLDVGADGVVTAWRVAGEACIDILRARLR